MARNPLMRMLSSVNDEYEEDYSYSNPYDDGTLWSSRPSKNKTIKTGIDSIDRRVNKEPIQDPMGNLRSQVDYYSKELNDIGMSPEEPEAKKKASLGSTALKGGLKLLEIVGSPISALTNAVSGAATKYLDERGKDKEKYNSGDKAIDAGNYLYNTPSRIVKALGEGLKSGANSFISPYSDKAKQNVTTFSDMIDVLEKNPNEGTKKISDTLANNLFAKFANEVRKFGTGEEMSKEQQREMGKVGFDVLANLALSPALDIQDAGKALKYLNQADKVEDKAQLGAKFARDLNKLTDNKELAKNLVDKSLNQLGAMSDFQGLKIGENVVLSRQALNNLSQSKLGKGVAQVGLTAISPLGGVVNNPLTAKIGDYISNTPAFDATREALSKSFKGGKNSKLIYDTIQNAPEDLAKVNYELSQRAAKEYDKIDNIVKSISDVQAQMKANPKDRAKLITNIIEKPESVGTITVEQTREILNPEYLKEAAKWNNTQLKDYVKANKKSLDEYNKLIKNARSLGYSTDDISKLKNDYLKLNSDIKLFEELSSIKDTNMATRLEALGADVGAVKKVSQNNADLFTDGLFKTTDELKNSYNKILNDETLSSQLANQVKTSAESIYKGLEESNPRLAKYLEGMNTTGFGDAVTADYNRTVKPLIEQLNINLTNDQRKALEGLNSTQLREVAADLNNRNAFRKESLSKTNTGLVDDFLDFTQDTFGNSKYYNKNGGYDQNSSLAALLEIGRRRKGSPFDNTATLDEAGNFMVESAKDIAKRYDRTIDHKTLANDLKNAFPSYRDVDTATLVSDLKRLTGDEISYIQKHIDNATLDVTKQAPKITETFNDLGLSEVALDSVKNTKVVDFKTASENIRNKKFNENDFETVSSLFDNSNREVRDKAIELVGKDNYNAWADTLANMPDSEFGNIRKKITTTSEAQAQKLDETRTILQNLGADRIETLQQIKDGVKNIEKRFGEYVADNSVDSGKRFIEGSYVTDFEKQAPELAKKADEMYGKFKQISEEVNKQISIDNAKQLTDSERKFMDKVKNDFKEMGIKEGLFTEDEADNFATYVAHILTPEAKQDKTTIALLKKRGFNVNDPLNIHGKSRTLKGSVEDINKNLEKKIFEENIYKIYLQRKMFHENFVYNKEKTDRMFELFGEDVLTSFKGMDKANVKAYKEAIQDKINTGDYVLITRNKGIKSTKEVKEAKNMDNIKDTIVNVLDNPQKGLPFNVVDGNKVNEVLTKGEGAYLLPTYIFKNYQDEFIKGFKQDENMFLKAFDKFNNLFKAQAVTTGTFHVNNAVGNAFNSWLLGGVNMLNPIKIKQATDILRGKNGKLGGMSYGEITDFMRKQGLLETQLDREFRNSNVNQYLQGKVDKLFDKGSPLKKAAKNLNPLDIENFAVYKGNRALGNAIEEQAKVINFITHLENGMNKYSASDMVKKALFDYSDLTDFESSFVKRIIPFYTFMRKNVPTQLNEMMNKPLNYYVISKAYKDSSKLETDRERGLKPDYLDGMIPLGNQRYLNINTPLGDLNKITSMKDMASSTSPIVRLPFELAANKQMFTGQEISKDNKAGDKLKYTAEALLPLVRILPETVDKATTAKNAEELIGTTVLDKFVKKYDLNKQEKATMYNYLEQLKNQYYSALEENPELRQIAEQKEVQRKNRGKQSNNPLVRLLNN